MNESAPWVCSHLEQRSSNWSTFFLVQVAPNVSWSQTGQGRSSTPRGGRGARGEPAAKVSHHVRDVVEIGHAGVVCGDEVVACEEPERRLLGERAGTAGSSGRAKASYFAVLCLVDLHAPGRGESVGAGPVADPAQQPGEDVVGVVDGIGSEGERYGLGRGSRHAVAGPAESWSNECADVRDESGCFDQAEASAGGGEVKVLVGRELKGVWLLVHAGASFEGGGGGLVVSDGAKRYAGI